MAESMTLRERMLTVLRGGETDRTPWNVYGWLLPQSAAAEQLISKGLSLMGYRRLFREITRDVTIRQEEQVENGETVYITLIETPYGNLTQRAVVDRGYGTSLWIRKYFISGVGDYPAAEYFLRHTHFEPDFEAWKQEDTRIGDKGFTAGEIMPVPIMTAMVNWLGVEGLSEGIYYHTEAFESFLDALNEQYDRQIQLAAESPAEIIWFGDNVTGTIISPKLFERYLAPVYARVMPVMRAAGKIPIAHYDGSNKPLVKVLAKTELPVIEAFTPPPGGDLTVREAKAAWTDKVIGVNFPGALFLETAERIYEYTMELMRDSAPGGRWYMGCTEDFPLEHFEKTFTAIGQAMADYEGLPF